MKESDIIKRAAYDLYIEQLKWSIWFIVVLILLHISGSLFSLRFDFGLNDMFAFSYVSTPIYMLVIGIIAGSYYLPFYVRHGVSRKDYFIGSSIAAFMLSLTLAAIFKILSYLENGIYSLFNLPVKFVPYGSELIDNGGIPIIIIYILTILMYYAIGWMIFTGFYRFKWMVGLVFVVLGIAITSIHGNLWSNSADGVFFLFFWDAAKSNGASGIFTLYPVLATVGFIAFLLLIIRLNTKKVPIKI